MTARSSAFLVLPLVILWGPRWAVAEPPPGLADSVWPIFHHDASATACTPLRGPEPGDRCEVQVLRTRAGGPSPWTIAGEAYADGSVPLWGGTLTHVTKAVVDAARFELVDKHRVDFEPDLHWNCLMLSGNRFAVLDPKQRTLRVFRDKPPRGPEQPIEEEGSYTLPDGVPGLPQTLTALPAGAGAGAGDVLLLTDAGWVVAVSPGREGAMETLGTLDLTRIHDDVSCHNMFPTDATGAAYLVSDLRMTKVRWDGAAFGVVWDVPYDTRGPKAPRWGRDKPGLELLRVLGGHEGTGCGTTPTLLGDPEGGGVVAIVDGHTPNNLVLFWAGEIPADAKPLDGLDPRVAAVLPLPFSTPAGRGFSMENSPCGTGHSLFLAQWNGIFPVDDPLAGVQRVDWDPATRELSVRWARGDVAFNSVGTLSTGSGLVYGFGQDRGRFRYLGLDWETGEARVEVDLGADDAVFDGGNQQVVLPDRSVVYGSKAGLTRVRVLPAGG